MMGLLLGNSSVMKRWLRGLFARVNRVALLRMAREYPALVREHCCGWDARERSRDGYRDVNADRSFSVYNRR